MTIDQIAKKYADKLMEFGFSDKEELLNYFTKAITEGIKSHKENV